MVVEIREKLVYVESVGVSTDAVINEDVKL